MSFGYLPLPAFLVMFLIVSGMVIYYSIKEWKNGPKALSIGLFILGILSFVAVLNRLDRELQLFGNSLQRHFSFTFWIWVIGIIFLMIGSLQKVNNDAIKKRYISIMIGILCPLILIMVMLELYLSNRR